MNKQLILPLALVVLLAFSCKKSKSINSDPIDNVPVTLTINMSLPLYSHLLNTGTHIFQDGGVKGVVIVHHTDDNFYAFDRCCSYQPKNSCSRLEVDSSVMIFRCGSSVISGFQKCCDSKFFMSGDVFNGPASFGLKRYQVIRTGNVLDIKN